MEFNYQLNTVMRLYSNLIKKYKKTYTGKSDVSFTVKDVNKMR